MYIGLRVKYTLFCSNFNETCIFLDSFSRNIEKPNFMKIRPVGAQLFHADGRTDITKSIVPFRNSAKSLKNEGGLVIISHSQLAARGPVPA